MVSVFHSLKGKAVCLILLRAAHASGFLLLGDLEDARPSSNRPALRSAASAFRIAVAETKLFAAAPPPSWSDLEHQIFPKGGFDSVTPPVNIDSVFDPQPPSTSGGDRPILFRERHGWCPYSERVWWALELLLSSDRSSSSKNNEPPAGYDTVRIDNTGHGPKPPYWSGTTPQVRFPGEARNRGESMDLVCALDELYSGSDDSSSNNNNNNHLLLQSDAPAVRERVARFRSTFPQRARPSSRAAFLFQSNGEPLWKSTFEETLQKTNGLLLESGGGPFFCGAELTAADVAWAPFLERYRYQLPALHGHRELRPDCPATYPALAAWYAAVDAVPSYACRVAGNAGSWRKVLTMAGFGNAGSVPPQIREHMAELQQMEVEQLRSSVDDAGALESERHLWNEYRRHRPYLAATPAAEAAHVIARNRQAILKDTLQRSDSSGIENLPSTESELDDALRQLAEILLRMEQEGGKESCWATSISPSAGALAAFLDQRSCVPRDMGALSAKRIAQIAALSASR